MGEGDAGHDPTVESTPKPAKITGDEPTIAPSPAATDPDALPVVERGHYAVADEVGRGGLGRILRAHDQRLHRTVAVKEMLSRDPAAAARFVREAMVTARLQHPSIVAIYEAGRWPTGEPFYAMKLVTGRPLDARIREAKDARARLALLPHVLAVAEAMAYAHGERVIHRDLKPQNVLVGAFGETVVIDWGLAKDLADTSVEAAGPYRGGATGETIAGAVMGTPAYMPPEQARGERADERSDVYALGAILYHTLAGRPPFTGATVDAILEAVLRDPPPPLDAAVPPDLAAIVTKAMAKAPADRYPTANEMADELRRFQTGQLVGAHRYSTWTLIRRWMRRHRGALAVAAAALVVIAALSTIGVARIMTERDRARAGESAAATARDDVKEKLSRLYEEQGRQELLGGRPQRALLYLGEAYALGDRPSLRFLLARALPYLEPEIARTIDAGSWVIGAWFSADGKSIVTQSMERKDVGHDRELITIWDAATGAPRVHIPPFETFPSDVAISPDGREVLALHPISNDLRTESPDGSVSYTPRDRGEVIIFDAATGAEKRRIALRGNPRASAWANGGKSLVTLDATDGMIVWDGSGARLGGASFARVAAVSRDGTRIYAGDGKRGAVYDAATLAEITSWKQTELPNRAWFSRDDENVYLALQSGFDQRSAITGTSWTMHAYPPVDDERVPGEIHGVASGEAVAVARGSRAIVYYGYEPGVVIAGHERDITAIDISADSTRVLTASEDGTARVWDAKTGRLLAWLDGTSWIDTARFAADGAHVLTSDRDGKVRLWDVPVTRAYADTSTESTQAAASFAWSPDGARLAMASDDGSIGIWDAATGARTGTLASDEKPSGGLAWSPDGAQLLGAGETIRIWDTKTGAQRSELNGLRGAPTYVTWTRVMMETRDGDTDVWDVARGAKTTLHGRALAVDGELTRALMIVGAQLTVIDLVGGKSIATITGVTDPQAAAISPDGARALVVDAAGDARIYDARTGRAGAMLADARGWTKDPAFSPDGSAVAADDGTKGARIWDAATGALRVSAEGHRDGVTSCVWSPDGALLATTSMDRSVKIWDANNGSLLASLDGHEHWVLGAVWSPDGAHLATDVARAWVVRMWDVHVDRRSRDEIARVIRCGVPLRLVEGRPLPAPTGPIDPSCARP
ncbi:MAG TPA: protein kinase [Kofleriaceae bacterium]|nr:protein kinase [Kofleriaceae bacterium]